MPAVVSAVLVLLAIGLAVLALILMALGPVDVRVPIDLLAAAIVALGAAHFVR